MLKILDNILYFHKEDFLALVEDEDYKSIKDFKIDLVPKLMKLFKLAPGKILLDHPLGLIVSDKGRKAEIAVLGKKTSAVALIVNVKIESKMGTRRPLQEDIKQAKAKLFKTLQYGRVSQGILLTDRRCIFLGCEFDEKFRIKNPHTPEKLSRIVLKA